MFLPQVPHYVNIIEAPDALKNLYRPVKDFNKNTITKVIGRSIENLLAVGYNEIENICVQRSDE